uniref:Cadherin domain-containing protein n=1 Tax=Anopheles melas TaxID=34690 RepID=A0A182TYX5_9DIPT
MTTIRYPVFCANFPERLKSHRARLAGSTLVVLVCINHRWEALSETRRARLFAPPWTPENPHYHYQVVEEQPIGTILTTVQATDADSTIAEYRMTESSFFEIHNTTGKGHRRHRLTFHCV